MDSLVSYPVWQSIVWFRPDSNNPEETKCFLVSTVNRPWSTCEGVFRGEETLVFFYNIKQRMRAGLIDREPHGSHVEICEHLMKFGTTPTKPIENDNE